jgi:hypothetical protein
MNSFEAGMAAWEADDAAAGRRWAPSMTRAEYDALWDRVTAGEPDPTPYGMGGDWCPFCGSDWKQPHAEECESPYAR